MTDYVPTTEDVRASADWGAFTNREEFNRWLAEVIRAAREEGHDTCMMAVEEHIERNGTSAIGWPYNPYRKEQQ
jgi:hypothetical protein